MTAGSAPEVRHHLTVDVEEFFHASALADTFPRHTWDDLPRRAPEVMHKVLDLLEERKIRATFFVVGWLAEREPEMVRAFAEAGHEVASHSWDHRRVVEQTPTEFRASVRRTKAFLEDLVGQPVRGFRAPSFSIVPGFEWALDVLLEEGYRYDSSLFPVAQHPSYGYPEGERDPHRMRRDSGTIVEIPPSTLRGFGTNFPAAGGAYIRLFPYVLVRTAFRQAEARGAPGTFYVHPWELDDRVPDLPMPRVARLRTFGRMRATWKKLRRLTQEFAFQRVDSTLEEMSREGR